MWLFRKITDMICGVIAILLSVVLILVLAVLPITLAGNAVLDAGLIQEVALSVVKPEFFGEEAGSVIQEVLGTETARDVLELYLDDLFLQMEGEESKLDVWGIMSVVENNMDELIPMYQQWAEKFSEKGVPITEDALKVAVYAATQKYGDTILDNLPTLEELGLKPIPKIELSWLPDGELLSAWILDSELLSRLASFRLSQEDVLTLANQALILVKDGLALRILLHLAALLTLLILVLRLGKGFRCLFWVGMNYLLAGSLAASTVGCLKLLLKAMTAGTNVAPVLQAAQAVIDKPLICACVILGAGILLVVTAKIGDKLLPKSQRR